ncbi:MAG: bifunctional phosphopantothenoylcysteine decarboxylase/phosphopantothenate--cysteine ligase CoaBC [Acidobacteriota bacterium]
MQYDCARRPRTCRRFSHHDATGVRRSLAGCTCNELGNVGQAYRSAARCSARGAGSKNLGPRPGSDGEVGVGRMVEPDVLVAAIEDIGRLRDLDSKTVLITAGPTREPLDPVRYLSNRSSGKMGFSLAAEAAARGAETRLVCGPVDLPTPVGVERFEVETAAEMQAMVERLAPDADIVVMAAAVADFRPQVMAPQKIKKGRGAPILELVANPDILERLREIAPQALRIGFAAETENLEAEAQRKLQSKGAHFIVANDVSKVGIGFDADVNEVTVFSMDQKARKLPVQPKRRLARELFDLFSEALQGRDAGILPAR